MRTSRPVPAKIRAHHYPGVCRVWVCVSRRNEVILERRRVTYGDGPLILDIAGFRLPLRAARLRADQRFDADVLQMRPRLFHPSGRRILRRAPRICETPVGVIVFLYASNAVPFTSGDLELTKRLRRN